uniref:Uncharacterized protein n=1 Tax=Anguilla anguilla TaxID=7936 RepID=A0A0E9QMH2_ANGAN
MVTYIYLVQWLLQICSYRFRWNYSN